MGLKRGEKTSLKPRREQSLKVTSGETGYPNRSTPRAAAPRGAHKAGGRPRVWGALPRRGATRAAPPEQGGSVMMAAPAAAAFPAPTSPHGPPQARSPRRCARPAPQPTRCPDPRPRPAPRGPGAPRPCRRHRPGQLGKVGSLRPRLPALVPARLPFFSSRTREPPGSPGSRREPPVSGSQLCARCWHPQGSGRPPRRVFATPPPHAAPRALSPPPTHLAVAVPARVAPPRREGRTLFAPVRPRSRPARRGRSERGAGAGGGRAVPEPPPSPLSRPAPARPPPLAPELQPNFSSFPFLSPGAGNSCSGRREEARSGPPRGHARPPAAAQQKALHRRGSDPRPPARPRRPADAGRSWGAGGARSASSGPAGGGADASALRPAARPPAGPAPRVPSPESSPNSARPQPRPGAVSCRRRPRRRATPPGRTLALTGSVGRAIGRRRRCPVRGDKTRGGAELAGGRGRARVLGRGVGRGRTRLRRVAGSPGPRATSSAALLCFPSTSASAPPRLNPRAAAVAATAAAAAPARQRLRAASTPRAPEAAGPRAPGAAGSSAARPRRAAPARRHLTSGAPGIIYARIRPGWRGRGRGREKGGGAGAGPRARRAGWAPLPVPGVRRAALPAALPGCARPSSSGSRSVRPRPRAGCGRCCHVSPRAPPRPVRRPGRTRSSGPTAVGVGLCCADPST
ncbi:basic proline-rich protein-like [Cavia porcellus]|uniref:basic proline-rich protein-like n=1 Tax=Cavia porcellus TaxID=10141 RepID=UPI002FDFC4CE